MSSMDHNFSSYLSELATEASVDHNFNLYMSELVTEAPNWIVEPEASIYFHLKHQYRRMVVSSEGVLSSIADGVVKDVMAQFRFSLHQLSMPELCNYCCRHIVSFFDIPPQIHERLVAQMVGRACQMAGMSLRGREKLLVINMDVQVVTATMLLYNEEGAVAQGLRESTRLEERRSGFGMVRALNSSIESLERLVYGARDLDQSMCTVCLDAFSIGSHIVKMPCSHIFHNGCIIKWLERSHSCPLCRFQLPQDIGEM